MNKLIVLVTSLLVCSFAYGASTITTIGIDRLRGGQVDVNVPLRVVKDVIELSGSDINDTGHDFWDGADINMLADVRDGNVPYRYGNKWANGPKEANMITTDGDAGTVKYYSDPNWLNGVMTDKIVVGNGDGNMHPADANDIANALGYVPLSSFNENNDVNVRNLDANSVDANDINAKSITVNGSPVALVKQCIGVTEDFVVLDSNDGATFYIDTGATKDINATLPDANLARVNFAVIFEDNNNTWGFNIITDPNATNYDVANGLYLTTKTVNTGAARATVYDKWADFNSINVWYSGGDVNAI